MCIRDRTYDAARAEIQTQLRTLTSENLLRAAGERARAHMVASEEEGARVPRSEEPLCPRCGARLMRSITYKTLEVPEQGGDGTASVLFLFCAECGHTLDDLILPGE